MEKPFRFEQIEPRLSPLRLHAFLGKDIVKPYDSDSIKYQDAFVLESLFINSLDTMKRFFVVALSPLSDCRIIDTE